MARIEPPLAGDEVATQLGSLERQRATFAWKCGGLDAEGLRKTVGVSTMTLGGLLKHMALVEVHTFGTKFRGLDAGAPWNAVDWDATPDWEWRTAADDRPEELMALYRASVARARSIVEEALAENGLDTLAHGGWPDGRKPSLRRFVVDMIEEYARHTGHADLLREAVDGLVGEDPPEDFPPV